MYPVAPLAKGHTLAVACTSYNGEVFFGLTADRDAMPDVEEFADLITEAIEELLHTVPPKAERGRPCVGAGTRPWPRWSDLQVRHRMVRPR